MKPNFSFGQFIVKKMRPLKDVTGIPGMGMLMYSEEDYSKYGVFSIEHYIKGDWEAPIEYKVRLVPVGKFSILFMDHDFYTLDLIDTKDEMIFNDLNLAEKFVEEFLID